MTSAPPARILSSMEPSTYRITVRGRLSERFAAAFDGMAAESRNGETVLVGRLRDQAELYGVLNRLRDLGIELIRVEEAE
jgi:hypothetical protein